MASQEDLKFFQHLAEIMSQLPEFRDDLQVIIEELKSGSIRNWSCIRNLISHLHRRRVFGYYGAVAYDSRCKKIFDKTILMVLSLFHKHKCSDFTIISDILLCFTVWNSSYIPDEEKCMNFRFMDNDCKRPPSMFEKTLVSSYKDIPTLIPAITESVYNPTNLNWLEISATGGDVNILKTLIKFGATLIVPKDFTNELIQVAAKMQMFATNEEETEAELHMLQSRVLYILATEFDQFSKKRIYFIHKILEIFGKYPFLKKTDDHLQCARIFIECTPEPIVTSAEIKKLVTRLCGWMVSNEKLLHFLKVYESAFPESREAYTPRSLEHLSRFQVRESLRTARLFPHGVYSLCLPQKIKDYIMFKDITLM